ncbi:hypothetical protein [Pseudomonas syringae]|uniref:hypothetical protein n=1 Tax=Pseudomonas syringae TaxID=317 RepID=UPI00137367FA|nr:hypothetical protein [Pseudomonas syringae]
MIISKGYLNSFLYIDVLQNWQTPMEHRMSNIARFLCRISRFTAADALRHTAVSGCQVDLGSTQVTFSPLGESL